MLPWKFWRVWLTIKLGQTPEYYDALDITEASERITVVQMHETALAHEQAKAVKAARLKGRRGRR